MEELASQTVLIFSLAGIRKKDILPRAPLSPRKFFEKMRRILSRDETEAAIHKARKRSTKISNQFPYGDIQCISTDEKERLEYIITKFVWKIGLLTENQQRFSVPRLIQHLVKISKEYIYHYNKLISQLDNKWLQNFGIIYSRDLYIDDVNQLASIIRQTLDLKLIRQRGHQDTAKTFLILHRANDDLETYTRSRLSLHESL